MLRVLTKYHSVSDINCQLQAKDPGDRSYALKSIGEMYRGRMSLSARFVMVKSNRIEDPTIVIHGS